VVLHYLQDLPLGEVALVLDRSVETIRTHLRRARKTLAVYLDVPEEQT
jgi:DNA-directed RNA polymerase specialized sigma24 family protein